jgi:phospholipid transport system substrate-binding protein
MAVATPLAATEMGPLESLKGPFDKVIKILNDPVYKDSSKKTEQRGKIWATVQEIFDFDEISKRAVARDWKKFSAEEKKEFSAIFSEFLGNTYVDKIQGEYHNEKIVYIGEDIVKKNRALARTKILREAIEIPVDYKMKLKDDKWMIYDVAVEGISLIKNYRTQFKSILAKKSPAELIERLKKKLKEQKIKLNQKG